MYEKNTTVFLNFTVFLNVHMKSKFMTFVIAFQFIGGLFVDAFFKFASVFLLSVKRDI